MALAEAFDVIVVGAGPAGCAAALAQAHRGRTVLLLEANPNAANRLAGEWLHPRAVRTVEKLGVTLPGRDAFESGRGFVVFPDDGSEPIALPYPGRSGHDRGWSGEHRALVDRLREAADGERRIDLRLGVRVRGIEGQRVTMRAGRSSPESTASAPLIVGADGRSSVARRALGLDGDTRTLSRMAGLRLRGVELPRPGFGHVFLGAPGPLLAYRIGSEEVRVCVDVPSGLPTDPATLFDLYSGAVPVSMRDALRDALAAGRVQWAANQSRPRAHRGRPGLVLVGDAAGCSHPLTALGMTLGIPDAVTLADERDFDRWVAKRRRSVQVPELLASVLYDVFRSDAESAVAIRRRMYRVWREHPRERERTIDYLAGEESSPGSFATSFVRVAGPAAARLAADALARRSPGEALRRGRELSGFAGWLARSITTRRPLAPPAFEGETALMGGAGMSVGTGTNVVDGAAGAHGPEAREAVARAARALVGLQGMPPGGEPSAEERAGLEGGFEGEVFWCGLLAAQYALFCHLTEQPIPPRRRARLLLQLERTRDAQGLWGLHPLSPPYLFTTTLAYVAARLLGEPADASWLRPARDFIAREDATTIPSWGKLWLALLGLYDWRGVPPIVPELFALPRSWPIHPSKFYCHTRHIYLAMSVLYTRKPRATETPRIAEIRRELHPRGMARVDWTRARRALRGAEIATPPGLALRLAYELGVVFERLHGRALRRRTLQRLESMIRWELGASDHSCLSPVSGMLSLLALHASPRPEPELKRGLERLEAWIFEDDVDGTRVAGARSASWDTAFALQALDAAAAVLDASEAQGRPAVGAPEADALREPMRRGADFLVRQQITSTPTGFDEAYRLDPMGGFCFAHGWHGWPVSDCTAEAIDALVACSRRAGGDEASGEAERLRLSNAVRFMLQCQNRDGGFGSYEAKRSRVELEWLNPAEMFGDSMTEHSYPECTASCLSALRHARGRVVPSLEPAMAAAAQRAERCLRRLQRPDGAWAGVWGVHLIYGTAFGVRGLAAAGAASNDPALRRAVRFLLARQNDDGGWSESHEGCLDGRWVAGGPSRVTQSAWALLGLLDAGCADWPSLTRAASFLIERLPADGRWPREEPSGVFFRTALLDYDHYRQVFPLWALSRYESRRRARAAVCATNATGSSEETSSDRSVA